MQYSGGLLHEELRFLLDHVLALVANEDAVVANHAAYAAVLYAELCPEIPAARADLAGRVLQSMAADVRLPVRHGAAYGAARLRKTARSSCIRAVAEEVHALLAGDQCITIRRQAAIGEAEASQELRKPGDSR